MTTQDIKNHLNLTEAEYAYIKHMIKEASTRSFQLQTNDRLTKETLMAYNKNVFFVAYNQRSKGMKELAKALNCLSTDIKLSSDLVAATRQKELVFINWGFRGTFNPKKLENGNRKIHMLNPPTLLGQFTNKVSFFDEMSKAKVSIPEYTRDLDTALGWTEEGHTVMGRNEYGSSGLDIKFIEDMDAFTQSSFWVKYKKKKDEYRLHFAFGNLIDAQRKALRKTDPITNEPIDKKQVDFRIRNLRNGFVFVREDVVLPKDVRAQAEAAFKHTGYDFGAVDVIYNETEGRAYVLEVNSSPGLQGSTIESYAQAFRDHLPEFFKEGEEITPKKKTRKKGVKKTKPSVGLATYNWPDPHV